MAGKPATQASVSVRIAEVTRMLLSGKSRAEIVEYALETWSVKTRQADEYIATATSRIEEANKNEAPRNLALITAALWDIAAGNRISEPDVSRKALMDIAKLRGLDREELNVNVRHHKDADDSELERAAAAAGSDE